MNYKRRIRILLLSGFLFILFSVLIVQYFYIQVIQFDRWEALAQKQHYFKIKEPFIRGSFYANNWVKKGHPPYLQPLAFDVEKYHLYIDPGSIKEEIKIPFAQGIKSHLSLSEPEEKKILDHLTRKSRCRQVAMWLNRNEKEAVLSWWEPFCKEHHLPRNALYFVSDYCRSHPFGSLLGQVLHTVQTYKEESTNQALPTGGLELSMRSFLEGKQGERRLMRSPRNALATGEVVKPPEHGSDVFLTINHYLQAIAEEELSIGLQKLNAKSGWAFMMDPYNGHMLAMAQYPAFNPQKYKEYFNDPRLINETRVKGVCDAQEPGSTMKAITLSIALLANKELEKRGEKPLFDPEAKIPTSNGKLPHRSKPLKDLSFHRYLNLDMAAQKSSNIYVATLMQQVVDRLGAAWYKEQLQSVFGFGRPTGIELKGESWGVVPTPGKLHPNGKLEWSGPTPHSLAMGHNIQVNSLQLLRAYAMLINGGYEVTPTLIRQVVDKEGNVLVDNLSAQRAAEFPHRLDPAIGQRIARALRFVTKPGGSVMRANIEGYTSGGKTGTADKIINGVYSEKAHLANFVGFAPADNPVFLLLVVVDEPEQKYIPGVGRSYFGAVCAAPLFSSIASRSLHYLGIKMDDPDRMAWKKEGEELKNKYDSWNIPEKPITTPKK